jgi:D-sedoheptulose 7-phosphate isomerase
MVRSSYNMDRRGAPSAGGGKAALTRHFAPSYTEPPWRRTMPTEFEQRATSYLKEAASVLGRLPVGTLDRIFGILLDAYRQDRQVLVMGNGGSAALASHFAVDLGKGTVAPDRRRFRVTSIVDNTPIMTAYANDMSYADVFSEQILTLAKPGDVVFGISGSGNSPNVLNGLKAARRAGATTVVLTGYAGGKAIELADVTLVVPSDDMQHIEDCHLMLMHLFMQAMVEQVSQSEPAGGAAPGRTTPPSR